MSKKVLNKILIVDSDQKEAKKHAEFLEKQGFRCKVCHEIKEAVTHLKTWRPQLVVCDLLLPDGSAYELIKRKKANTDLKDISINFIFMSSHNEKDNVEEAIKQGVSAYMVKPFSQEDLLKKVIFQFRNIIEHKEIKQDKNSKNEDASLMLYLTHLLLKQSLSSENMKAKLFKLTKMLSMKTEGVRCSIINCIDLKTGVVVHSSDTENAVGIKIDLDSYPEVLYVKGTNTMIAVMDLKNDENLAFIKQKAKSIDFNSLVVCPIWRHERFFGVLSLKLPESKKSISNDELRFIEIVANVIGLTLSTENYTEKNDFWLKNIKQPAA